MEAKLPFGGHIAAYKQYKADTESIAGWLAVNAAKCGYEASMLAHSSTLPRIRSLGERR
jgi:hypothetical protein